MFEHFTHNIPFLALMSTPRPGNRPLATRLSEQAIVAIIAASLTLWISNDRQDQKIEVIVGVLKELKTEVIASRVMLQDHAVMKQQISDLNKRVEKISDK